MYLSCRKHLIGVTEFYLQEVKQADEEKLSEVFGEAEHAPQRPGAVGCSAV